MTQTRTGTKSRTTDPGFVGHFSVSIGDSQVGAFTEVTGLSVELEVAEIKEGGVNDVVHKRPGSLKWPNVVLKKGVTDQQNLFEWFEEARADSAGGGSGAVRTATLVLHSPQGAPLRTWHIEDAFPIKWTGPDLSAGGNGLASEQLEIAHHGFRSE